MSNLAPAWIFGGTSTLGLALARRLASEGRPLVLLGRNPPLLDEVAADLAIRHVVPVVTFHLDAGDPLTSHPEILDHARQTPPGLVILVWGDDSLPPDDPDIRVQENVFQINFTSHALNSLTLFRTIPDHSRAAWVFIGSVGGSRPRAANLLYTSAKHALHGFTEGFRQLACTREMTVHLIILGYMRSPMSTGKCPDRLAISPDSAARSILSTLARKRAVAYIPMWWLFPCVVLRLLPSWLWGRLGAASR